MLKEFVEKIVSLKENKIYEINGESYSDNDLVRIAPHVDRPSVESVTSLDSIVKLIKNEMRLVNQKIFVRVTRHDIVEVFTAYDKYYKRNRLYDAKADTPSDCLGWNDYENAMIAFRSRFKQTEDIEYLLSILSRISDENSITSEDNGVTQKVEARAGIALAMKETVRPRVTLAPFRTFLEVDQPESEFLLRLREGRQIGLFEADGGMWKLQAKSNIKDYLEKNLEAEIAAKNVVVMV